MFLLCHLALNFFPYLKKFVWKKINFQDNSCIRFLHTWLSIKILSKQIHLIQISVSLIEIFVIGRFNSSGITISNPAFLSTFIHFPENT